MINMKPVSDLQEINHPFLVDLSWSHKVIHSHFLRFFRKFLYPPPLSNFITTKSHLFKVPPSILWRTFFLSVIKYHPPPPIHFFKNPQHSQFLKISILSKLIFYLLNITNLQFIATNNFYFKSQITENKHFVHSYVVLKLDINQNWNRMTSYCIDIIAYHRRIWYKFSKNYFQNCQYRVFQ